MSFTDNAWSIFNQSILKYHELDDVNSMISNPFHLDSLDHLLYKKNWIDTVQWHLEDIIRNPDIDPVEALRIKRWIDKSNQERTDTVEYIDSWFLNKYANVKLKEGARLNTESPAWALDRLSILSLKVFHMQEESERITATTLQKKKASDKLNVLLEQKSDLTTAIEELISDIENGSKRMKTYKQMKMYNDQDLNPVLYNK